ncbi:solute carrier family 2, facilitated glucose transporter member 5-like [Rhineura floridana]|uniref:solute carrier family 2, facilitated glucose transporter member 5-like n=1 Tax=Rhineura floridana TaxID=261503 RepID=UPI002AC7E914|nr:solute carrier family 2, facilitated glucose transporter member 5-like [Rhineura floridana]
MKNFYNETYRWRNTISIDHSLLMFLWGLTVSFFPLGGIFGSLLVGPLADSCGRKGTLLINNILAIVSAILVSCSKAVRTYEFIIFSRLIIGVCAGISFSVVPMYLTEIAPDNLRGAIGMMGHLFITFGSLVARICGLREVLGTQDGWPILLSLTGLPALLQAILLPYFPESPRYLLIQRKDKEAARQALKTLRDCDDVEGEIEDLHQEALSESTEKEIDLFTIHRFEDVRRHLVSAIVLMGGQQLSGVNAAHHYAERLYQSTGLEDHIVGYIGMMISILLMFITLLAICVADSSGRKTLLLTGLGFCSTSCILLAMSIELQKTISWMSYFSSSFVIIFLIGQSVGPDPVLSVLIAELFLQSSRSTAFVIGGCVHWLCKFLIGVAFLHLEIHIEPYSFLLSWPLCVATLIYSSKVIPETTGQSFLEIRRSVALHVTRSLLLRQLAEN